MFPRLLVSVSDVDEAEAAVQGGAQVIDIKDPRQGPLGRASTVIVTQILNSLSQYSVDLPISAALGETSEWLGLNDADQQEWLHLLSANSRLRFLKLGPAGLTQDWETVWNRVRRMLVPHSAIDLRAVTEPEGSFPDTGGGVGSQKWVAVAYADNARCGAPASLEIAAAAIRHGCRGVLVDTGVKDDSRLLDWISVPDLQALRKMTSESGMILALAGQICTQDLTHLAPFRPDIIAVRGAVCHRRDRTRGVQQQRVREFRSAIEAVSWT